MGVLYLGNQQVSPILEVKPKNYVEGEFVLASNGVLTPIITHDLGSTNLFGTIELVSAEDNRAVIPVQYSLIFASFNTIVYNYKGYINVGSYSTQKSDIDIDFGSAITQTAFGGINMTQTAASTSDYAVTAASGYRANIYPTLSASQIAVRIGRTMIAGLTYRYRIWKLD